MPASLWKSLTVQIIAPGHSLHEAQCIAAVIVIECLVVYTIMGYRFRDAEREWSPAVSPGPETCRMTLQDHCGTLSEGVDREGIFLPHQLDPARPDSRGEQSGINLLPNALKMMIIAIGFSIQFTEYVFIDIY